MQRPQAQAQSSLARPSCLQTNVALAQAANMPHQVRPSYRQMTRHQTAPKAPDNRAHEPNRDYCLLPATPNRPASSSKTTPQAQESQWLNRP